MNHKQQKIIKNELTRYCNHYYLLRRKLIKRIELFNKLVADEPLYRGETLLTDIDAMICQIRRVQALQVKMDQTRAEFNETGEEILEFFKHFRIPPNTALTGIIEYDMEYQIWADEDDKLHMVPIRSLAPDFDDPNVMYIKFSDWEEEEED